MNDSSFMEAPLAFLLFGLAIGLGADTSAERLTNYQNRVRGK